MSAYHKSIALGVLTWLIVDGGSLGLIALSTPALLAYLATWLLGVFFAYAYSERAGDRYSATIRYGVAASFGAIFVGVNGQMVVATIAICIVGAYDLYMRYCYEKEGTVSIRMR